MFGTDTVARSAYSCAALFNVLCDPITWSILHSYLGRSLELSANLSGLLVFFVLLIIVTCTEQHAAFCYVLAPLKI